MDTEISIAKLEEKQKVAHSILLFFAMEKAEQENYFPAIDPEISYVSDGDTGDKTKNPAYYFGMRSMDYLAVFSPRCSPVIGNMLYEMRELVYLMAEISPDPPVASRPNHYSYLWLVDPLYSGVSGSASILWRFLRRYSRSILADPAWKFEYPLLSFEEIGKHLTV